MKNFRITFDAETGLNQLNIYQSKMHGLIGRSLLRIFYLGITKYIINSSTEENTYPVTKKKRKNKNHSSTLTLCFSAAPLNTAVSTERRKNNLQKDVVFILRIYTLVVEEIANVIERSWMSVELRWISATILVLCYHCYVFSFIAVWWLLYIFPPQSQGRQKSPTCCSGAANVMLYIPIASLKVCKSLHWLSNFPFS